MDRGTRLYLPSYHAAWHVPQRRIGWAWFFGLPVPWLVRRCRSCLQSYPCPTTVRGRVAAGARLTWMTETILGGRLPAFVTARSANPERIGVAR
ncbi:hypothetical protein HNR73_000772 [Phytomonospora endophytica]|uniref:Uncharacterized protein n=1 Tax=Phytomonospora endophytica TaxID=714109 RepID=A0A841FC15_9ACTN|nr:hypothetical protein [Phytomonospora endophytica]GIG65151.1 hypothetical protein Pen01_14460 [Phytomonospora endophytica]